MTNADDFSGTSPQEATEEQTPTIIAHQSVEYRGPLPPPHILAEYDQLVPGAAQTMIQEWQASLDHERRLETETLGTVQHTQKWAPAYRLATVGLVIAGGLIAVVLGEPAIGWFLGLGAAIGYPAAAALMQFLRSRGGPIRSEGDADLEL